MKTSERLSRLLLHALLSGALVEAPLAQEEPVLTSGRPIPSGQSVYDVTHYALDLKVDPEKRSIEGRCATTAVALADAQEVVLDLHDALTVTSVRRAADERELPFRHAGGEIRIDLELEEGERFVLGVTYRGTPREAPRPPWDGGFVWARTADGKPWIATANQMQGADLWWPCKDQPGDEPDSMDIVVSVPRGLVCASNGRLVGTYDEGDWSTFHWKVSTPINAYGVALNIAPYRTISSDYTSVTGDVFPITYWVLPENFEQGKILFEDILRQVRWFEETFGPYPFRADKYGVAETPHLGMEHQSIIAYGNEYRGNPWGPDLGFDFLHHHEMAHEWWANLVTAHDWKDFWIHEGFATYAQALYVEKLHGAGAYREEMRRKRGGLRNAGPLAPRETRSSADVYFGTQGGDIYNKGSWVLHTLRFLVGDEVFFPMLRRMAYPDPALERTTDGSACRFSDTEEIRAIAERGSGRDLGWFFEAYVRQAALPRLVTRVEGGALHLRWEAAGELPFPMPVELRLGGELLRVDVNREGVRVPLPPRADGRSLPWSVDPHDWVLRAED